MHLLAGFFPSDSPVHELQSSCGCRAGGRAQEKTAITSSSLSSFLSRLADTCMMEGG